LASAAASCGHYRAVLRPLLARLVVVGLWACGLVAEPRRFSCGAIDSALRPFMSVHSSFKWSVNFFPPEVNRNPSPPMGGATGGTRPTLRFTLRFGEKTKYPPAQPSRGIEPSLDIKDSRARPARVSDRHGVTKPTPTATGRSYLETKLGSGPPLALGKFKPRYELCSRSGPV
jgi:hypothetical protein